jgi:hypothetical protein
MHYAHGYLGASFFSPLANQRTDQYGGSIENRMRFHLEALDAVREVWPEKYPLTMRLGSDDLHPDGVQFEDSIEAIRRMKEHGLDLADLSLGFNTDEMTDPPFNEVGFMLERASRVATGSRHSPSGQAGIWGFRQTPMQPSGAEWLIWYFSVVRHSLTLIGRSGPRGSLLTPIPSASCRRTGVGGFATSEVMRPASAGPSRLPLSPRSAKLQRNDGICHWGNESVAACRV